MIYNSRANYKCCSSLMGHPVIIPGTITSLSSSNDERNFNGHFLSITSLTDTAVMSAGTSFPCRLLNCNTCPRATDLFPTNKRTSLPRLVSNELCDSVLIPLVDDILVCPFPIADHDKWLFPLFCGTGFSDGGLV